MTTDLDISLPGGKTGILLLHDLGGSAAELRGLAQSLQWRGYTVLCPQLVALGPTGSDRQGGAGMLVSATELALSRLRSRCDSVVVMGQSYGAMLALELARHNASFVQAVVLVEPRAWLPAIRLPVPSAVSGRVSQAFLGRLLAGMQGLTQRAALGLRPSAAGMTAVSKPAPQSAATLVALGKLLDSVHAGLPSVKQPVLLLHGASKARAGVSGSVMLQHRLGGRIESVMLEDATLANCQREEASELLAERTERFVAAVLDELETRRGNEARRQKMAAGRSSAA
jgi:carboxylesterase